MFDQSCVTRMHILSVGNQLKRHKTNTLTVLLITEKTNLFITRKHLQTRNRIRAEHNKLTKSIDHF